MGELTLSDAPFIPKPMEGFQNYSFFASFLFIRSGIILAVVILFDVSVRKSQYALTATFRSLKIDSNQMSAFGITTSGGKKNEDIPGVSSQVLSNYKWVIRIALLLVTCYLWDELIMSSRAYDMSLTPEWNMLVYSCLTGWYCFGFPTSGEQVNNFDDFMRVSFSWDLQPICKIVLASDNTKVLNQYTDKISVSCFRYSNPSFATLLAALGVSLASYLLVAIAFEMMVSLLLRHKRRVIGFASLVDLVIFLTVIYWVGLMILTLVLRRGLNSVSAWVSRLTFLAVPLILFNARRTASRLRQIANHSNRQRARRFQGSEFGNQLDAVLLGKQKARWRSASETPQERENGGDSNYFEADPNSKRLKHRAKRIRMKLVGGLRRIYS